MPKSLYFYVDERGNNPVKEFMENLPEKEKSKVHAYMAELREHSYNLRRPMADYLGNGLYELRPRDNRIFYFFFLRDEIVLLHAIRKRTDRIPEGDLSICQKRKRQVEEGIGHIEKINL